MKYPNNIANLNYLNIKIYKDRYKEKNMDNLIIQAPSHLSREEIEEIYKKNNNDTLKTLEELWNIEVKTPNLSENTIKWNNIRDTCDSFDIEMQKKMFKK